MIETIFRVIVIMLIISLILVVITSISIQLNLPFQYGGLLLSFLNVIFYFLPIGKLMPILVCVVSLTVFKIGISLLKTLWSIFPLKG